MVAYSHTDNICKHQMLHAHQRPSYDLMMQNVRLGYNYNIRQSIPLVLHALVSILYCACFASIV